MNIRLFLILSILAATCSPRSTAGELPRDVFAHPLEDELIDFLFFGLKRPLIVRVRLRVDGQGFRARYFDLAGKMLRQGDLNHDGVLDLVEGKAVVDRLTDLTGPIGTTSKGRSVSTTAYPSGRSNVEDLARFLQGQLGDFAIEPVGTADLTKPEPSFHRLDLDHDGALSRQEIAGVASTLASLDLDDDETVTADELAPYQNPFSNRAFVGGRSLSPRTTSWSLSILDGNAWNTANQIYHRYSLHLRNQFVGIDQLRIDRAHFERIDADGDGQASILEMERVIREGPDFELMIRLGRREPGEPAIEVVDRTTSPPFGRPAISTSVDGSLTIPLENDVIAIEADPDPPTDPVGANYRGKFQAADLDGNKILDRSELNRDRAIGLIAIQADLDQDDRLTEGELEAYFGLRAEVAGLRYLLTAGERLRSIMDILDLDRDQKIGLREIRNAPHHLALEDGDGDGRITPGELIKHQRWVFRRGRPNFNIVGVNDTIILNRDSLSPPVSTRAPLTIEPWFTKMDRNRDGDLSPREFLGNRSTFDAYDTNRDGLIDPIEAARALDLP